MLSLQSGKRPCFRIMVIQTIWFYLIIILKSTQVCSLEKLNSKEMYNIQILHKNCEPTGQIYYKDLLNGSSLEWKEIYLLPRLTTIDNKLRVFQYKILHHVLFPNKRLFRFYVVLFLQS